MTTAVSPLLVRSYAGNVYRTGRNRLSNIAIVNPTYVEPVMLYAAQTYYTDYIDAVLAKGWITPEEHAETIALKTPTDPGYMTAAEQLQAVTI